MGAVASLSREATLWGLDIAQIGVFLFGFFFLAGWIAEETTKEHRWNRYRTLFIVMAIVGVGGEWIADIAVFALSEHLQTISDKEVAKLKLDTQQLATDEAAAHRDIANANARAKDAEARAAEANEKTELERGERMKLEAKIAPRTLDASQQSYVAAACRRFAGHTVRMESYALDVEGQVLAWEISAALTSAGLHMAYPISDLPFGGFLVGARLTAPISEQALAVAIYVSLTQEGIGIAAPKFTAPATDPVTVQIGVKPFSPLPIGVPTRPP